MPYIPPEQRGELNTRIDQLVDQMTHIITEDKKPNETAYLGVLNYVITRISQQLIRKLFGGFRYHFIAGVTGALENVKQEFYRRIAGPYEDDAISNNGDVDETSEALGSI